MFLFSDSLVENLNIRYILKIWCSTIFGREKLEKKHPQDVSDPTFSSVRW